MGGLRDKIDHIEEILHQFPSVLFIVLLTICFAVFSPFVYVSIINGISNTQILTTFPFKGLVENNIDVLKYGLVIVPVAVLCIGLSLAQERYSRIISRFY